MPPARPTPTPSAPTNARGPSLNMDWDDEELSTQIYDRPADASDYLYESYEAGGGDDLASLRVAELGRANELARATDSVRSPAPQAPRATRPPAPPRRTASYASNAFAPDQLGQPVERPATYQPPLAGARAYGSATQSPQSYEVPNGYEAGAQGYDTPSSYSEQAYSNFPDANAPFANEATPPPGVHVSPRAYSYSEPGLPRVEPVDSLRAPPATETMALSTERPSERTRNPIFAALAVAAVVLLCFVGYVFLARTEPGVVQLTTHPADAVLVFDGKPWGTTSPFVVTNVSPNDKHVIAVSKPGYRPWSQEVQVQAGQTLQFPVTLEPAESDTPAVAGNAQGTTGGFTIETSPSGATVLLDGQELSGVTPLRVGNLLARPYEVGLKLNGFKDHQARIAVTAGVDQSVPRVVMQPVRVRVRVTSEPSGGEAVITRGSERRVLGRTPADVTLENEGAPWNVEVSKSGYESFGQPLAIRDGTAELSVRAVLSRRGGDDTPVAASSEAPRASRSSAAEPKSDSKPEPVAAKEKEKASEGGPGTLRINSRPWSQVTIDGKSVGNTPQMNLALPSGTHKVTLVNPEFNLRKNLSITIKPGQVETQIVALQ